MASTSHSVQGSSVSSQLDFDAGSGAARELLLSQGLSTKDSNVVEELLQMVAEREQRIEAMQRSQRELALRYEDATGLTLGPNGTPPVARSAATEARMQDLQRNQGSNPPAFADQSSRLPSASPMELPGRPVSSLSNVRDLSSPTAVGNTSVGGSSEGQGRPSAAELQAKAGVMSRVASLNGVSTSVANPLEKARRKLQAAGLATSPPEALPAAAEAALSHVHEAITALQLHQASLSALAADVMSLTGVVPIPEALAMLRDQLEASVQDTAAANEYGREVAGERDRYKAALEAERARAASSSGSSSSSSSPRSSKRVGWADEEMSALQAEASAAQAALAAAKGEVEEERARAREYAQEVQTARMEIERLRSALSSHSPAVEAHTQGLLASVQQEQAQQGEHLEQLQADREELRLALDRSQADTASLAGQVSSLSSQLKECQAGALAARAEVAELTARAQGLQEEARGRTEQLEGVQQQLSACQALLSSTSSQCSLAQEARDACSGEVLTLNEEVNRLQEEAARLQEESEAAQIARLAAESELESCRAALDEAGRQSAALHAALGHLAEDARQAKDEAGRAQEQAQVALQEREEALALRDSVLRQSAAICSSLLSAAGLVVQGIPPAHSGAPVGPPEGGAEEGQQQVQDGEVLVDSGQVLGLIQQAVEEVVAERESLLSCKRTLTARALALTVLLSTCRTARQVWQGRAARAQDGEQQLKAAKEGLEKDKAVLHTALSSAQEQVHRLTSELQVCSSRCSAAESLLTTLSAQVEGLTGTVKLLQGEVKEARSTRQSATAEAATSAALRHAAQGEAARHRTLLRQRTLAYGVRMAAMALRVKEAQDGARAAEHAKDVALVECSLAREQASNSSARAEEVCADKVKAEVAAGERIARAEAEASARVARAEADADTFKALLLTLGRDLESAQAQAALVPQLQAEVGSLKDAAGRLGLELEEKTKELQEVHVRVSALSEDLSTRASSLAATTTALAQERERAAGLQVEVQEGAVRQEQLAAQLQQAQAELHDSQQSATGLAEELGTLKRSLAVVTGSHEALSAQVEAGAAALLQAQARVRGLEEQLGPAAATADALLACRSKCAEAEAALSALQSSHARLACAHTAVLQDVQAERDKGREAEERATGLAAQAQQLQAELATVQEQLSSTRAELERATVSLSVHAEAERSMQHAVRLLAEQTEQARGDREKQAERVQELTQELESTRAELSHVRTKLEVTRSALDKKVDAVSAECDALAAQVALLQGQLTHTEGELRERAAALQEEKEVLARISTDREAVGRALSSALERCAAHEQRLHEAQAVRDALAGEVEHSRAGEHAIQQACRALSAQVGELSKGKESALLRCESLSADLAGVRAAMAQVHRERQEQSEGRIAAEVQVNELQTQVHQTQLTIATLQGEVSRKGRLYKAAVLRLACLTLGLTARLRAGQATIVQLQAELAAARVEASQASTLVPALSSVEEERRFLRRALEECTAQLSHVRGELEQARGGWQEAQAQRVQALDKQLAIETALAALQQEHSALDERHARLVVREEECQVRLGAVQAAGARMAKRAVAAYIKAAAVSEQLKACQETASVAHFAAAAAESLAPELAASEAECRTLKAVLGTLTDRLQGVEGQLGQVQGQLAQRDRDLSEHALAAVDLTSSLRERTDEVQRLQGHLATVRAQVEGLQGEAQVLLEERSQLQDAKVQLGQEVIGLRAELTAERMKCEDSRALATLAREAEAGRVEAQAEAKAMREALLGLSDKLEKAQAEGQSLAERYKSACESEEACRAAMAKLQAEHEEGLARVAQLEGAEEQVAALEAECALLKALVSATESQTSTSTAALQESSRAAIQERAEEARALRTVALTLQGELDTALAQLATARQEAESAAAALSKVTSERAELAAQLSLAVSVGVEARAAVQEAQAQARQAREDREAAQAERDSLAAQAKEAIAKASSASAAAEVACARAEGSAAALAEHKADAQALRAAVMSMQDKIAVESARANQAEAKAQDRAGQIDHLSSSVTALGRQLASLRAHYARRLIAANVRLAALATYLGDFRAALAQEGQGSATLRPAQVIAEAASAKEEAATLRGRVAGLEERAGRAESDCMAARAQAAGLHAERAALVEQLNTALGRAVEAQVERTLVNNEAAASAEACEEATRERDGLLHALAHVKRQHALHHISLAVRLAAARRLVAATGTTGKPGMSSPAGAGSPMNNMSHSSSSSSSVARHAALLHAAATSPLPVPVDTTAGDMAQVRAARLAAERDALQARVSSLLSERDSMHAKLVALDAKLASVAGAVMAREAGGARVAGR